MERVSRLLRLVTDAPGSASGWMAFLQAAGATFSAPFAGFVHWEEACQSAISLTHCEDADLLQRYAARYASVNPWILRGASRFTTGMVLPGEALITSHDLERTEFFNDFLLPHRYRYSLGACVESGRRVTHLSFVRPQEAGPFSEEDIRILSMIGPHVRAGIEAERRSAQLRAASVGVIEALDALPHALVVISRGRVTFANAAARSLATVGLWELNAGELRLRSAKENGRLQQRLVEGARWLTCEPTHISTPLLVTVDNPQRARFRLAVTACRLPGDGCGSVNLIVTAEQLSPGEQVIARLRARGLTARECEVAQWLLDGLDPLEIAARLQLKENTMRSHLKQLYAKTGTRGYHELRRTFWIGGPSR